MVELETPPPFPERKITDVELETKSLTIKISNSGAKDVQASNLSTASSPYGSPLLSPPSSAFVSALQSPYISPRLVEIPTNLLPPSPPHHTHTLTHPSPPVSYSGSQSDDIPSTSYTPPPESYDFCDELTNHNHNHNQKLKIDSAPRISFSFPVPRISFAKNPISPASNGKLRSCDVYIGYHGENPNLTRFCKWLKSELEIQGIACFTADRAKYSDTQSHEIADRVICSVTFGVVVITPYSVLNPVTIEEIRFFAQKKNLIPLYFDTDQAEITDLLNHGSDYKDNREAIEGLMKSQEFMLEANEGNWRSCVCRAAGILTAKLGRKSVAERREVEGVYEELPFLRNKLFVDREREITEIETAFFGSGDYIESIGQSEEESEVDISRGGRYICLEVGRREEPKLEAWVEPIIGRNSIKRSKSGKYRSFGSSVVCISGAAGIGKTELALEFAHRYCQRYKMVLWVGGEAQYFRQNILNLSLNLGLDVSADADKERGRIRSFEEQEGEAFKRVKRELFRDMPYLLIIDNLETEKEWWEGKDLHDLIPRNTGGTHVIVTTRLSRVMNFDPMQLQPLPLSDAMNLIKGRRKKDYPVEEIDYLGKFDEKVGRLSFGLWVIGSLLSELQILPSALFEAINHTQIEETSNLSVPDEQFCRSNTFLMKVIAFCDNVVQKSNLLTSQMLLAGGWFAPTPISTNLLVAAAKSMPNTKNRFKNWTKCCCLGGGLASPTWKSEEDSSLLLVKLGLARRANKQSGCWIQFHPITQIYSRRKGGALTAKAAVQGVRKIGNPSLNSDHLWASAFLVFGFKSAPPLVQMKVVDIVLFIKKTALPLAIRAFTVFSRCNAALELLKVCTNVLEEVEKSFVSQIQDWCHGSLCWKKKKMKLQSNQRVDEYLWQDVTLLKAALLETRAKLLLKGGLFDSGEELCRTCISIRTVMLGHNHSQTLAAQETLAKLVRMRSKI